MKKIISVMAVTLMGAVAGAKTLTAQEFMKDLYGQLAAQSFDGELADLAASCRVTFGLTPGGDASVVMEIADGQAALRLKVSPGQAVDLKRVGDDDYSLVYSFGDYVMNQVIVTSIDDAGMIIRLVRGNTSLTCEQWF